MKYAILVAVAAASFIMTYQPTQARAASAEEELVSGIQEQQQALGTSLAALKGSDRSAWTDEELGSYLSAAMFLVYDGTILYVLEHKELPKQAQDIVSDGKISSWPDNPLNDWKPMQVFDSGTTFSPGDMVLQRPPHDYWSGLKNPAPCSFTISIYGPRKGYAPASRLSTEDNVWAQIPADSYLLENFFKQTTAQSQKKYDQLKKKKEEEQKQKQQPKADGTPKVAQK